MMRAIQMAMLLSLWPVLARGDYTEDNKPMYSGNSRLTVANINNTTKVLRDPSVAGKNLQQHLSKISGTARSKLDDIAGAMDASTNEQTEEQSKINDPTKMSGSFRAALGNMTVRQTTTLTTTGTPPDLPKISLAAIVYGNDQEYHAMLHVDDRTVLIKEGDKATFIDNNKVIEIVVQEITRSDIRLAVYPSNQLIVLR